VNYAPEYCASFVRRGISAAMIAAAVALAGCATAPADRGGPADGALRTGVTAATPLDPDVERRILALDPDHVSDQDVRGTLAHGPTPQIILLHGGVYGTHLLMQSFGHFLSGMGYPDRRVRDPSDGAWSQQPFGSTSRIAGEIAWYYERDGVRPMIIGHSQGGIQAVKVLYELNGAFNDPIPVWNPVTDQPESRTSIVDPLTHQSRPVVGMQTSFVAVVGAGGIALAAPPHWGMAARLHTIPNTVEAFTGFTIDFDPIAWTVTGSQSPAYQHNGTAIVRNVDLPASYSHVFVPVTQSLAGNPHMREWLNAYVPGSSNGEPPGSSEGRATNALFAADVWYSIKKSWCLEAQRLVKARRAASASR
jgi:hypothetical protein